MEDQCEELHETLGMDRCALDKLNAWEAGERQINVEDNNVNYNERSEDAGGDCDVVEEARVDKAENGKEGNEAEGEGDREDIHFTMYGGANFLLEVGSQEQNKLVTVVTLRLKAEECGYAE
jgi:hypothetical protein